MKLLDFGLARALGADAASAAAGSLSMSPTITTPAMTHAGMSLGTAAYMSPQQAKGRFSPEVGACIRRCLQKDPRQRFGDMQSARLALDGAFDIAVTQPAAVPASTNRRERWLWAGALVVVAAVAAAAARFLTPSAEPTDDSLHGVAADGGAPGYRGGRQPCSFSRRQICGPSHQRRRAGRAIRALAR